MSLTPTPNQTVGPFFHIGLTHLYRPDVVGIDAAERLTIQGRVLDGDGNPVNDALIEVWQADAQGRYTEATGQRQLQGVGRAATDENGAFRFSTIKPGRVAGPGGVLQAPHLAVAVFMRGLLRHLVTRVYFPDEQSNLEDPVLKLVPEERRHTLIARSRADDARSLEWNVILQGPDETVFFDY